MCCAGWGYSGFSCVSYCSVLQTAVRFSCAELSANTDTAEGRPVVTRKDWLPQRCLLRTSLSTWKSHKLPHCKAFLLPYPAPKKIRLWSLCRAATSWQFWPSLGLQNRRDGCPWRCGVTNASGEKVSGRSVTKACSLISMSDLNTQLLESRVYRITALLLKVNFWPHACRETLQDIPPESPGTR